MKVAALPCSRPWKDRDRYWPKSKLWLRQALTVRRGVRLSAGIIIGWPCCSRCLEARCGVSLGGRDVYLSVAGGYRIAEPAGDLAAAAALLTSAANQTRSRKKRVFFGEVALSGAIRPVARMEQRLKEAARLGFEQAFVPDGSPTAIEGLTITPIKRLSELVELIAPEAIS